MKRTTFAALIALVILSGCGHKNTDKKTTFESAPPLEYVGTYDEYRRPANVKTLMDVSLVANAIANLPDGKGFKTTSKSDVSITMLNEKTQSTMMYTTATGSQSYFITEKKGGKEINLVLYLSPDSTTLSVEGSYVLTGKDTTRLTYRAVEQLIADRYQM